MMDLPYVSGKSVREINILLINPNSTRSMTEACLRSVERNLPVGVNVFGFTAPSHAPTAIEGKLDGILSAADCTRALVPLLRDSSVKFDAFLVACFSAHPLISALREELSQPTIGIMEAALYACRMCGDKLGIISTSERSSLTLVKSVADYGLSTFSAGAQTGHVAVLELESKPKEEVYAGLTAAAKKLVFEKGADCVCLGCAGMTEMNEVCQDAIGTEQGNAMVVDGVAMGVHFLAALVREDLKTAKAGANQSSSTSREERGQAWL